MASVGDKFSWTLSTFNMYNRWFDWQVPLMNYNANTCEGWQEDYTYTPHIQDTLTMIPHLPLQIYLQKVAPLLTDHGDIVESSIHVCTAPGNNNMLFGTIAP
jgi:hypothetical protein